MYLCIVKTTKHNSTNKQNVTNMVTKTDKQKENAVKRAAENFEKAQKENAVYNAAEKLAKNILSQAGNTSEMVREYKSLSSVLAYFAKKSVFAKYANIFASLGVTEAKQLTPAKLKTEILHPSLITPAGGIGLIALKRAKDSEGNIIIGAKTAYLSAPKTWTPEKMLKLFAQSQAKKAENGK